MAQDYWDPKEIKNSELTRYIKKLDRYIVEMNNCESAALVEVTQEDYDRIMSYSAALRSTNEKLHTKPRSDFPYSRDTTFAINYESDGLDFTKTLNEDIVFFMQYFADMMMQNARCDSANARSGISADDYNRNLVALDRFDMLTAGYVVGNNADQPQHSAYEIAKRGNGGGE